MHFLKLYCFRRFCVCVLVFHVVPMNFQGIFGRCRPLAMQQRMVTGLVLLESLGAGCDLQGYADTEKLPEVTREIIVLGAILDFGYLT